MAALECYIDIVVQDQNHRINIKHEDRPCDAQISVDGSPIETRVKMLPSNGGAHFFDVGGTKVILTISRNEAGDAWDYDCFVGGRSVLSGMPWTFSKLDYPSIKRWERQRRGGKGAYFTMSCAKGALIGCVIFLVILAVSLVAKIEVSWVHLVISIVPLTVLYAAFAPFEWKNNEQAYAEYRAFLDNASAGDAPMQSAQPAQEEQPAEQQGEAPSAEQDQPVSEAPVAPQEQTPLAQEEQPAGEQPTGPQE